jgi:hypothetical protein
MKHQLSLGFSEHMILCTNFAPSTVSTSPAASTGQGNVSTGYLLAHPMRVVSVPRIRVGLPVKTISPPDCRDLRGEAECVALRLALKVNLLVDDEDETKSQGGITSGTCVSESGSTHAR